MAMLENLRNPSRRLLGDDDEVRVVAAIARAESGTSGEIRIHIESRCAGDPADAAARWFLRLGMDRTAERNGVLFYVAAVDRKFAVIGDEGFRGRVSPTFWSDLRDRIESRFRTGDFASGLEQGIHAIGQALERVFPGRPGDRNELPDDPSYNPPS